MIKSELRKLNLARQKSINAVERAAASERIRDRFFAHFDLAPVKFLHSFIPIEKFNEIDTRKIIAEIWRTLPGVQVVVPRVDFVASEIRNLKFGAETELVKNAWDIDEPTNEGYVETVDIDMVLVPGLAFDTKGHRVGYGKGFYDRFLKECRSDCVKIGLTYFEPVDEIEGIYEGDVAVDYLVTPIRVYRSAPVAQR